MNPPFIAVTRDFNILDGIRRIPAHRAELIEASGVPEFDLDPQSGEQKPPGNIVGIAVGAIWPNPKGPDAIQCCWDHIQVGTTKEPAQPNAIMSFALDGKLYRVNVVFKHFPPPPLKSTSAVPVAENLERRATNADLVSLGDLKKPNPYSIDDLRNRLGLSHMGGYDITENVLSPLTNTPRHLPPTLSLLVGREKLNIQLGPCITLPPLPPELQKYHGPKGA